MAHGSELVEAMLVCEADDVIRHDDIVVLSVMVRCCMIAHLHEVAPAMVRDLLLPAKTPPVDFATKEPMHHNHRLLNILVDDQM